MVDPDDTVVLDEPEDTLDELEVPLDPDDTEVRELGALAVPDTDVLELEEPEEIEERAAEPEDTETRPPEDTAPFANALMGKHKVTTMKIARIVLILVFIFSP